MLEVANLEVVYNDVVLVLRGISIVVPEGKIVALLGANGAGKTTTIRAITGLLDVHEGDITKGRISWKGEAIEKMDPAAIVRSGITQVLEGRRVFAEMTVDENLKTGAFTSKSKAAEAAAYDRVMTMFPILADRRSSISGYLSGGEQQMLAMGRALMADPELLILDEPSLGLAPKLVQQVKEIIVEINKQGTGVLLIEQNANMALSIADRGWVIQTGKVVLDDTAENLLVHPQLRASYLGGGDRE